MGASYAEELVKVRILLDVDKCFQVRTGMGDKDRVEVLLFFM